MADDRHRGRQCLRSYRSKTDYFGDTSAQTTILNGLVAQSDALIKTLRPDIFRNYALICMAADGTDHCDHLQFVIGSMGRTGGEQAPVTRTDTSAAYSDIVFTLPDAWASYTLTITNKGTADAHLSDGVISLEGPIPRSCGWTRRICRMMCSRRGSPAPCRSRCRRSITVLTRWIPPAR